MAKPLSSPSHYFKIRVIALVSTIGCHAAPLLAQTVSVQTVDSGSVSGEVGAYASQTIVAGNPAVSYYNSSDGNLMFARNTAADGSGTWVVTVVDNSVADVGLYTSLAMVAGSPAISYYDKSNGDLKFARASNTDGSGEWTVRTLASAGDMGQYTSLAVIGANPAIAYLRSDTGDVEFAWSGDPNGSGIWFFGVVASNVTPGQVSLAEVGGKPGISYSDSSSHLVFARNDAANGSGTWTTTMVDSTVTVEPYSSLAMIAGNPAIGYYDSTNADLKYARNNAADGSGTWTTVTVDSTGTVGRYPSLAVIGGNPAISYQDGSNNSDLKFARNSAADGSGIWTASTVDSAKLVGSYTSLTVAEGSPSICYYDLINGDLKHARNSASDGSGVWSRQRVDFGTALSRTGLYSSQAVVAGNPAVAYYDSDAKQLKFIRATDASGTSWGAAVTVDSSIGNNGSYCSLAVIGGNPAISYYNKTNDDLKFARNSAADGSGTWAVATVVSANSVGEYTSLAVINGKPAISYYDSTNNDLRYARNSAADGSGTWTTAVVDTVTIVGRYTSLAVIGGNPAISYYDDANGDLKFARNSAVDGSGTWVATTVDTVGDVGQFTSLAVIAGNPAISYFDATNSDLKFARNNAADGSGTWTIVTVHSTGYVGSYTSLAEIAGSPAISYFDDITSDLKFARNSAGDASGSWVVTTVDAVGSVGTFSSLRLVNGTPAISYYDSYKGDLRFARSNSADGTDTWTGMNLDPGVPNAGDAGWHTSQALVAGNPAIGYYDVTNTDLKFARNSAADGSGTWKIVTVDSGGSVGQYVSLAVIAGNPAISYYDSSNGDLKFARSITTDGGGDWITTTVDGAAFGDVGQYTSLAVVNGNPAISYYDTTQQRLKFARNSAADGSGTWTVTTADYGPSVGQYTSLAVIGGKPAISYFGSANTELKFARNSAADGSGTWTSVRVDSSNTLLGLGQYSSLAVIGGKPAISYFDLQNGAMKYARNSAVDGSGTWSRVTVESSGIRGGNYTSLAVIGSYPAIGYWDPANQDLKYARNSAVDGTGTWTPITIASTNSVGFFNSLTQLGNKAAISYYDGTNGDLNWVTVTFDVDNDGLLDSWEIAQFGSTSGHSALDDSDHDGLCELLELAFGSNPTLPSPSALPTAINESGYLTMTITKQAGVIYEVQSAGTLQPGQPESFSAASTTIITNNATTLKVRDNFLLSTMPNRFMRVKVTAAP